VKRRAVYISGVRFDPIMQTQLIDDIARHVTHPSKRSFLVVKPYVEFLAAAQADASKATLINQADRVVADGVTILLFYLSQLCSG
jgi:UDP-N-acetyl-D-mannosaminuronic acid transferase (WecB/TagA/CpsF family)